MMQLTGNTILITGGSAGIGLAFAERFLRRGNRVIVCGRSEQKLKVAKSRFPQLEVRACDIARESERRRLAADVVRDFPELNVLVNNAGIQQRTNLLTSEEDWGYHQRELATNLDAPLHLTMLLLPHLRGQENAAIMNVTSGLAFTPMAAAPVYCAAKAALHSFTISLRHQLSAAGIDVIEVAPPAVNTDLGGKGLHTFGAPLDEFADGVFQGLDHGQNEIGYGTSEKALRMSRDEIDAAVHAINSRVPF